MIDFVSHWFYSTGIRTADLLLQDCILPIWSPCPISLIKESVLCLELYIRPIPLIAILCTQVNVTPTVTLRHVGNQGHFHNRIHIYIYVHIYIHIPITFTSVFRLHSYSIHIYIHIYITIYTDIRIHVILTFIVALPLH